MTDIITDALSGWQAWALAGLAAVLAVCVSGRRRSHVRAAGGAAQAEGHSPAPIDADDLATDAPCVADWIRVSEP